METSGFELTEDGDHIFRVQNIRYWDCPMFDNNSGEIRWSRKNGVSFRFEFDGIHSIKETPYYTRVYPRSGVGRLYQPNLENPNWLAETAAGTAIKIWTISDDFESQHSFSFSDNSISCTVDGIVLFAVVEIPRYEHLSFENATGLPYQMFFAGHPGFVHEDSTKIQLDTPNGGFFQTSRETTRLSVNPVVELVDSETLTRINPSGWIALADRPDIKETEVPCHIEQIFLSFLNGERIRFAWYDQKTKSDVVLRTYFGWVQTDDYAFSAGNNQPLPLMEGIPALEHGKSALVHLPSLYTNFIEASKQIDFDFILYPVWTAQGLVLDDKLALASVSIERLSSLWKERGNQYVDNVRNDNVKASFWNNSQAKRKLRQHLKNELIKILNRADVEIDEDEIQDVTTIVCKRIDNLTQPTNSDQLQKPFEDLGIRLQEREEKALRKRNHYLHGSRKTDWTSISHKDEEMETYDILRTLLTKFVLKLCSYKGPFLDYSSRPLAQEFSVVRFDGNEVLEVDQRK